MMMAISGGAVIPLMIGWLSDLSSIVLGMSLLVLCMIYLCAVSVYCIRISKVPEVAEAGA
jgi:MFS transporter, FHS family, L-fucose permease